MVMVSSVAAPFAGVAGAQQGAPSGMVGVPGDNVGPPDHANGNGFSIQSVGGGGGPPDHVDLPESVPTHAAAWSVHSSEHAGDLEVTVGEVDGSLALVFSDDANHAGREVAVDAATLRDAVGHQPKTAYGLHEDGSRWTSPIVYENGHAVLEVPKFSSNTVTFEGTVSLTGSPASDGTKYSYNLSDAETAESINTTLTGATHRSWANYSQRIAGGSSTINVGGTTSAEGPGATGDPVIRMESTIPDEKRASLEHAGSVQTVEDGDYIYTTSTDEILKKLHKSNGSVVWETNIGYNGDALAADDSSVYVATNSGQQLISFSKADGAQEWSWETSGAKTYAVAVGPDYVYTGGSAQNNLKIVDKSGTLVSEYGGANGDIISLETNSTHVFVGDKGGLVHALPHGATAADWTVQANDHITGLDVDGSTVYAGELETGSGSHNLYRIDDGSITWSQAIFSDGVRAVETTSDGVYAGGMDNKLARFDKADGSKHWEHGLPDYISTISADGSDLWVGVANGELYQIGYRVDDPSVAVDGTTELSSTGRFGAGAGSSTELALGTGDHTIDVSTTTGRVDVSLEYQEVTETVNPELTVNGDSYRHTGTLADGESTSLDVATTSLRTGENTVTVAASSASNGPAGQVGLDYSHDAVEAQSVDYEGEAFSERYNVSKTYAADHSSETLTIPFAGEVVDVRTLETRTNGGTWTQPTHTLDDTELTVDLGSVQEDDTVEVRAIGTKVRPVNGSITVTQPTVVGDELASEIRIEEYGSDFRLEVNSTAYGNGTYHSYSESWTNPQSFARFEPDGRQAVHFPTAGAGETTRLGTVPLDVQPTGGHYDVRVSSAGAEPEFQVRQTTTASEADLVWRNTDSGSTYQLYSLSADEERDRATAQSPVTLTHSGIAELLTIYDLGGGGGGGGGGSATSSGTTIAGLQPVMLIGAAVGGLALLFIVSRRYGEGSLSDTAMFGAGALIIGVLAVQALAPAILTRAIGRAIENSGPLIVLGLIAAVIIWLRSRGDDVTLNIRGK